MNITMFRLLKLFLTFVLRFPALCHRSGVLLLLHSIVQLFARKRMFRESDLSSLHAAALPFAGLQEAIYLPLSLTPCVDALGEGNALYGNPVKKCRPLWGEKRSIVRWAVLVYSVTANPTLAHYPKPL